MAIALIGGLITSTVLTLVALPALYELSEVSRRCRPQQQIEKIDYLIKLQRDYRSRGLQVSIVMKAV